MNGVTSTGFENAMSAVETNPGKVNKGNKFIDVFSNDGVKINSFNDFFAWKIDKVTEKLRKLLKELQELLLQARKAIGNGSYDATGLAEGASEAVKSFAEQNSVDLAAATIETLKNLIEQVKKEIIALGEQHALGLIKNSNKNQTSQNITEFFNSAQNRYQAFTALHRDASVSQETVE